MLRVVLPALLVACQPRASVRVVDPWGRPVPGAVVRGGGEEARPAPDGQAWVHAAEGAEVVASAPGFLGGLPASIEDARATVTVWPEPATAVVAVGDEGYVDLPAVPYDRLDPPGIEDPAGPGAGVALVVAPAPAGPAGFELCPLAWSPRFGTWMVCGRGEAGEEPQRVGEGWLVSLADLPGGRYALATPDTCHPFAVDGPARPGAAGEAPPAPASVP